MDAGDPSADSWAERRLGAATLRDRLAARMVRADRPELYVGGVLAFLLFLLLASGILLMLHYRPTAEDAHASVAYIAGGLPYGDLIRGVHAWSSDLLVLGVIVQLISTLVRRAYRRPFELVWVSGALTLFVLVALAFTGAVLPWSDIAYVQARVGSEIAGHLPWAGPPLRYLMRGGDEVNGSTLVHAYGFHVAVLPAALTLLLGAHAALLRRARQRAPTEVVVERSVPVYPDFLVRQAGVAVGVLVIVITLATFWPRAIGAPADPALAATGASAQPPWYFLFVHDLLAAAPPTLLGIHSAAFIVGAIGVLALLALAVPFFDRRGSRVTVAIGVIASLLVLALSIHALL